MGEIVTTCEKIHWLVREGERWLKPEKRSAGLMVRPGGGGEEGGAERGRSPERGWGEGERWLKPERRSAGLRVHPGGRGGKGALVRPKGSGGKRV